VLLAAVLPNIMYVGHGPFGGSDAHDFKTVEDIEEHIAHCHIGPSSCSDQASLGVSWWVIFSDLAFALDSAPRRVDTAETAVILEPHSFLFKPPPRLA
jgi:hypothetical protein